ncbi:hypothetical protein BKA62DRAFT_765659 [Auriculariales sp. MPI-PUGE-AT-0066]|nr:hypothetical protein BKA62DRAFT_765659 [Auriculariales sp. MPI-PUGE-AT-0066]
MSIISTDLIVDKQQPELHRRWGNSKNQQNFHYNQVCTAVQALNWHDVIRKVHDMTPAERAKHLPGIGIQMRKLLPRWTAPWPLTHIGKNTLAASIATVFGRLNDALFPQAAQSHQVTEFVARTPGLAMRNLQSCYHRARASTNASTFKSSMLLIVGGVYEVLTGGTLCLFPASDFKPRQQDNEPLEDFSQRLARWQRVHYTRLLISIFLSLTPAIILMGVDYDKSSNRLHWPEIDEFSVWLQHFRSSPRPEFDELEDALYSAVVEILVIMEESTEESSSWVQVEDVCARFAATARPLGDLMKDREFDNLPILVSQEAAAGPKRKARKRVAAADDMEEGPSKKKPRLEQSGFGLLSAISEAVPVKWEVENDHMLMYEEVNDLEDKDQDYGFGDRGHGDFGGYGSLSLPHQTLPTAAGIATAPTKAIATTAADIAPTAADIAAATTKTTADTASATIAPTAAGIAAAPTKAIATTAAAATAITPNAADIAAAITTAIAPTTASIAAAPTKAIATTAADIAPTAADIAAATTKTTADTASATIAPTAAGIAAAPTKAIATTAAAATAITPNAADIAAAITTAIAPTTASIAPTATDIAPTAAAIAAVATKANADTAAITDNAAAVSPKHVIDARKTKSAPKGSMAHSGSNGDLRRSTRTTNNKDETIYKDAISNSKPARSKPTIKKSANSVKEKEVAHESCYRHRRILPADWHVGRETHKINMFPWDNDVPLITVHGDRQAEDVYTFAEGPNAFLWDGTTPNRLVTMYEPDGAYFPWEDPGLDEPARLKWQKTLYNELSRGQSVLIRKPKGMQRSQDSYEEAMDKFYIGSKWVEVQVPGVVADADKRLSAGTSDNYWMLRKTFTDYAQNSNSTGGINMLSTTTNRPDPYLQWLRSLTIPIDFIFDCTSDCLPDFTPTVPDNQFNFCIAALIWSYSSMHIDGSGQPTFVRMIKGKKIWTIRKVRKNEDRWLDPRELEEDRFDTCSFLLEEGDIWIQGSGVIHDVITLENSITTGGHWFCWELMQDIMLSSLHLSLLHQMAIDDDNEPSNASHNGAVLSVFDRCAVFILQEFESEIRAVARLTAAKTLRLPYGLLIDKNVVEKVAWVEAEDQGSKLNALVGVIFAGTFFPVSMDQETDSIHHGDKQHHHVRSWTYDYLLWRQLVSYSVQQLGTPHGAPANLANVLGRDIIDHLKSIAYSIFSDIYSALYEDYDWKTAVDKTLDAYRLNPEEIVDVHLPVQSDPDVEHSEYSSGDEI